MGELDLFASHQAATPEGAWSVAEVTQRARQLVETGFDRVWVRGELTGFKAYRSGHWYFTLRDRSAQIRCVMWRSDNERLREPPVNGVEVFVEARPTVWEERGEFRLTVKRLLATAEDGLWQLQLERARAALERDGLLDPARKRPLPPFPKRVAVVTSPDGAALRDIVTVIGRRWPAAEIWVVPTRVQGEDAVREICAALSLLDRLDGVEVAIVGRGGGSHEDLWAFNTEEVARAVAATPIPTVSAVGHETDVTLSDLVADLRAPTPSAAAEAVVPDRVEIEETMARLARAMARGLQGRVSLGQERLARTGDRLGTAVSSRLDRGRQRLERLGAALDAMSPLRVLQRGFAVARDSDNRVLRRVADFPPGRAFRLTLTDGDIRANVRES